MLGFNYRMDEMRAAIGLVQLQSLQEWNEIRRILVVLYRRLIAKHCPAVTIPFSEPRTSAYHIMPILLPGSVTRQDIIDDLRARQIQTTIHYPPVHQLTLYRELFPDTSLPRTEDFAQRELTIPLHPQLTSPVVEAVVAALTTALGSSARTGAAV
ncbi:DegT/DnrJ/EryC1/StrS family aminotransferase [Mesorhizobium sp. BAC0120]|uniref:DegT/DnrJ/EryC1/StrS family aminotransferase n=1 Tax=Mesorhizobium sp. BAC0120 TaxID=3090670 RepID=UPI00298D5F64|nr:DegT/DnrJ/EryC1/StrS family aminotransferase [Mesorhizobium sp. BAC0120]MDW6020572.1 DegT/DnrJ/EryC1/StrS family aminotransferase [Mesorhizobium sp. BAC0120]